MASNVFITDGVTKSTNLLSSNDPDVWQGLGAMSTRERDVYYARVAAAFRAFNLKANTVGNMPFCLYRGKREFDTSATWENKVGFLPNPSDLFRIDTLSYMATNTVYNMMTSDVIGYRPRGLYNAVSYNFTPWLNGQSTQVDYIERSVGSLIERYTPDGKQIYGTSPKTRLVYMWRFDHTTELLPSPNTEALAIMESAGVMHAKGFWIKHFYQRGGIKPTLISIKGLVDKDSREEKERSWSNWLKGVGKAFGNIARIINGENMSATTIGDGIGDMKDSRIHEEALADIAMGTGMPLSLLVANSANYATAKEEKATWYESDIIPLCNWLAYEYNRQVFEPLGLRLEFHPETLDPQQEDETQRAAAINTFMSFLTACPTYEIFIGATETFGYELSESLVTAAEAYYADKEAKAEEMREQMGQTGYVLGPDGKPISSQVPPQGEEEKKPGEEAEPEEEEDEEKKPFPPAKSAVKANEHSAMIALRVPDVICAEIQEKYPFVDSETLNELHITLVYLGDVRTLDKVAAVQAVTSFAGYQSPIKGKLQGLARFVNGTDVDPLVVTFDSHQMPQVYSSLTSCLDSYRIPYHKDHGFIPHMTLTYIPADADMPIETIEPIEINFSDVYLVLGNEWLTIPFVGYENKTKWIPTLDELNVLQEWRAFALRSFNKQKPHNEPFKKADGVLPDYITARITAALDEAQTDTQIKAAFVVGETTTPAPEYVNSAEPSEILILAEAINKLASKGD